MPNFIYFQAYPYIIPFVKNSTLDISWLMLFTFYLALIGLAMIFPLGWKLWLKEEKSKNIRRAVFNLTVSSFCIPACLFYGVGLLDIREECRTLMRVMLLVYSVPMAAHAHSRVPWFDPAKPVINLLKAAALMGLLLLPVLKKMLNG